MMTSTCPDSTCGFRNGFGFCTQSVCLLPQKRDKSFRENIAKMPTVGGWISAKDRLPEEKVWVLCLCRAGIREVLRWQNGQWYHDPQHAYFESFVLYWMPLPEPPKEDTDG